MKNRILILFLVIFVTSCEKEQNTTTSVYKNPRLATEFTFIASLTSPKNEPSSKLPRIAIEDDAHFEILANIQKIIDGDSPFAEGQQIVFLVHSPWLSFHSYGMTSEKYKFTMIRQKDPSMKEWEYLVRTMEKYTE
jgi:hypothetical protein